MNHLFIFLKVDNASTNVFQFFFQENILCTAYSTAHYLQRHGFKDKLYVVGNPSMAHEFDACGIRYTGIEVSSYFLAIFT